MAGKTGLIVIYDICSTSSQFGLAIWLIEDSMCMQLNHKSKGINQPANGLTTNQQSPTINQPTNCFEINWTELALDWMVGGRKPTNNKSMGKCFWHWGKLVNCGWRQRKGSSRRAPTTLHGETMRSWHARYQSNTWFSVRLDLSVAYSYTLRLYQTPLPTAWHYQGSGGHLSC